MNTIFVVNHNWLPMLATSFFISYLWSGNVKKIAFGDHIDRFVYAGGAALGCGIGAILAGALIK